METNVAQSRFWNVAGNGNSLMWRELDIAAESGVPFFFFFFRMKGMEKCGYICFLWKGQDSAVEAQPNLVQREEREADQGHMY